MIRATAGYDGMCRPRAYQDFVFVRGVFAGTLSPQPMDSRADGALGRVAVRSSAEIIGDYARYAASDPLCCPSRITIVVFRVSAEPPVVVPVSASTSATAESPGPARTMALEGTSWQLVAFEGGDGTRLAPDDRTKYTIEFGAAGRLAARIDCNHGRGTWTSDGPNRLEVGPLALTRAMCPPGSLHDQIVRQWANIRSYVIRNGHLFVSLRADGGVYELEPLAR
ncbi:MAG: LppP/LprE family lipoprotein [Acidobacteria bacterium]|nr:LppP/LprE family lipoprotein [Acidobacteriota bacterium]